MARSFRNKLIDIFPMKNEFEIVHQHGQCADENCEEDRTMYYVTCPDHRKDESVHRDRLRDLFLRNGQVI